MLKIENEHEKDEVEWNYLVGRIVEEEAIFLSSQKTRCALEKGVIIALGFCMHVD